MRALPPAKLFGLWGGIGVVITVGLVSLLWMSGSTEQEVLYAQLNLDDAAAMASKLREMGAPYTLQGDGTTIMVPSTMVHDLRLRLATEGLPRSGGVGFELFDQRNFGMTEFMQKLNYRRALQGELARTITQLEAIKSARVHIVLPEKTLFLDQQEKATASIILTLASGRRLTTEQIRGVTHLVASSVEGLQPEQVTVVDSSGKQLGVKEQDPALLSVSEAQLAHQQKLEQTLERRLQSLLARAIGKDKVLVRVTATLDFQHIERSEERFDADNPAVRSEQRSTAEGQGSGFLALGVPGVRANIENTVANTTTPGNTNVVSRQSETINYELSKVVSKIVAPSGEIKRLSVAVLIDGTYETNANGERTYVPRTEDELTKYQDIVKSAVGYNETRGDQVEIVNIPFEPREDLEAQAIAAEAERAFWVQVSRYGAYVILGLLCVLFVVRPLIKWITGSGDVMETMLPRTVQELEADMGGEMLPGLQEDMEGEPELIEMGKPTGQQLRAQVAEYVMSEPERTAEILRAWLKG
ncbi:MAG: flagellar basal-body MS-ring/collar protein FliF [Candidatus Tectomicrobia bacterium]